ncbi:hypothetical protein [Nocardia cyriacigeorgica]|uniref:hypothetical protein n=1 Tax=Nocardia cyriacigeorgica TaxID=135487 RepID=UPI002455590E|nr:hypothetical protein [Nocardia cyriacigeorgica]
MAGNFELFADAAGKFLWRREAGNGEIIAKAHATTQPFGHLVSTSPVAMHGVITRATPNGSDITRGPVRNSAVGTGPRAGVPTIGDSAPRDRSLRTPG